ncbi:unnamed protein product [Mytilus edulis]|uniref:Uncharacterized protein n=1 Tax=Mytilus edulis TaxID=6550 RepID=A0A8S3SG38_MYTED|nr:unnamed protein product [Mytilus edulis]
MLGQRHGVYSERLLSDSIAGNACFQIRVTLAFRCLLTEKQKSGKNNKRKKKGLWLHPPKRSKVSPLPQEIQNITTPAKKTSFTTPNKCHLTKAPKKATYNGSVGKNRRRLFTDSPEEKLSSDVQLILPSVLNNLNKGGYKEDFCLLLKGIASGKFPIHNIAFRLLLDIAKWYSLDNTTQMQYSSESMKFWKVVYRLFHGKALRFLSGEKSIGQVIDGSSSKGLVQSPYLKKDKRRIEKIQRRATKLVPSIKMLSYVERLRALGLPTLEYRRDRYDMIQVYKALHGTDDINWQNMFELSTNSTRGHTWKLIKKRCNSTQRLHSFSQRIIDQWNSLSTVTVFAESVNIFKNHINDEHWNGKKFNPT